MQALIIKVEANAVCFSSLRNPSTCNSITDTSGYRSKFCEFPNTTLTFELELVFFRSALLVLTLDSFSKLLVYIWTDSLHATWKKVNLKTCLSQ